MSKAIYYQKGETIDYINTTDGIIEANTIIAIGKRIGIAGTNIAPNEKGSLAVEGVYIIQKTSSSDIEIGTQVYFDGEGITETETEISAGYIIKTSKANDKMAYVKINT